MDVGTTEGAGLTAGAGLIAGGTTDGFSAGRSDARIYGRLWCC